jgi:hypothetical protein
MRTLTKQKLSQSAKVIFVLVFCIHFAFQKVVDNEANCGVLGSPENTCPYAFLDHVNDSSIDHAIGGDGEHNDHVCLNCPCNLQLSISWNLNLYRVYVQLNHVYIAIFNPEFQNLEPIKGYFRPPRVLFS